MTFDTNAMMSRPYTLDHKCLLFMIYKGEWLAIVVIMDLEIDIGKILNGLLLPPNKEKIRVEGYRLYEETIWDIRKQIGMVFQNPDNQFVGTTVQDDVAFGLENHGIPTEIMVKAYTRSIKKGENGSFLDQEPHHLSGGQKQRVAIAGVLAVKPSIIILDEATSMLDPSGREEVLETVRTLKEEKDYGYFDYT